jgi:hypothetical protein
MFARFAAASASNPPVVWNFIDLGGTRKNPRFTRGGRPVDLWTDRSDVVGNATYELWVVKLLLV